MDIHFPSLAQILSPPLLHGFTTSLLAFSHLLSFQRCKFTCGIFEKPTSWPFFQTLLLLSSHPKSPILLPPSLLPLFSYYFGFFLLFSSFFFLSSLSPSISTTLAFPTLVFTAFYTFLDTLSSILLLFFSQFQGYGK